MHGAALLRWFQGVMRGAFSAMAGMAMSNGTMPDVLATPASPCSLPAVSSASC